MPLGATDWGLFTDDGTPLVQADMVLSVEFQGDAHISSYPQQDGAFMSYNKVQVPNQIKLTYGVANSNDARSALVNALDVAKRSLTLYMLAMPEYSYPSVNVIHYAFRRTAKQGARLLQVDVFCEEVRILGRQYVRFGKSINSAGTAAQGNLQPAASLDITGPGNTSAQNQFLSSTSGLSTFTPTLKPVGIDTTTPGVPTGQVTSGTGDIEFTATVPQ